MPTSIKFVLGLPQARLPCNVSEFDIILVWPYLLSPTYLLWREGRAVEGEKGGTLSSPSDYIMDD